MHLHLTPDQKAFIRAAIQRGRFRRAEDAIV
jgi:Arc/MetJ-type ribon-helix-helix transcriptional regulator